MRQLISQNNPTRQCTQPLKPHLSYLDFIHIKVWVRVCLTQHLHCDSCNCCMLMSEAVNIIHQCCLTCELLLNSFCCIVWVLIQLFMHM